jgi:hypothetical protein
VPVRPARQDRAGLLVRRLSQDRVWELAEEIWTASSGDVLPARPLLDLRSSRAGASAQAAYRQHRERERASWRLGWNGGPLRSLVSLRPEV